jgi:hypothetical protein
VIFSSVRDPNYRVTRAQIVAAVVERLKGLDLDFEQKVFPQRARPFWPKTLPNCAVYALRESCELGNEAPRDYVRKLELKIELAVGIQTPAPDSGTSDAVDVLCNQVSEQIERDETLGGLVESTKEKGWEFDLVNEGADYFGFATMTYEVTYPTEVGEHPVGGFDNLRSVRAEIAAEGATTEVELATGAQP